MGEKALALIFLTTLLGAGEADDHWRLRQETAVTRISIDINDAVAWTDLAEAALMQGDSVTAASALEQVTDLRPNEPRGRFLSGCLALKERRHDDARVAFTRAVELDPSFVEARFFLGRTYRYLGKLDEALTHFAAVLVARPSYVAARTYRIRVLQDLGRSAERDTEIAALYALRQSGIVAELTAASAFRRDRLIVAGSSAAVLERFVGEPVRWRVITGADNLRRELVVCRNGNGWMLVAVTTTDARCLIRWDALPSYDEVRARFAEQFTAPWPPTGTPVSLELEAERDFDVGQ